MRLLLSEDQLRRLVRYFAYYELASGGLSSVLLLSGLAQVERLSRLVLLLYVLSLVVAGFVAYCGYRTLQRPGQGLRLSRVGLLMQLVGVAVPGYAFRFFVGPFVAASFYYTDEVGVRLTASLADVSITINQSDDLQVAINLVAALLFFRTTKWLNEWTYRYNPPSQAPAASPTGW